MANNQKTFKVARDLWNLEPNKPYSGHFQTTEQGELLVTPSEKGQHPECNHWETIIDTKAYTFKQSKNWFEFKICKKYICLPVFEDFIENIYKTLRSYFILNN